MAAEARDSAGPVLQFDAAAARRLEAMYMHSDVVERRRRVRQALALRPGERVLDIGCGPGFLTTEVAAEVGPDGWASGIDISEAVLTAARGRVAGQAVTAWVDFRAGDAVALPFPDGSFDAAVATQVYEYVADVPAAIGELYRVLRPGGRAVVVDTDWSSIVWHAADRARMSRILDAWDEHLAHPCLPRTLRPLLRRAGFAVPRTEVVTVLNLECAGYSHGVVGLVARFVAGRRGINQNAVDAWVDDLRRLDEDGAYFFSLNQYLFLATKPEAD